MILHLALFLSGAAQPPLTTSAVVPSDTAAVRVWLPDTLPRVGDDARVYVRLASGGHVMVLHADARGQIRVLFPETPAAADFVPGGRTFEIRGSGTAGTFEIPAPGAGLVLAIRSTVPFDLSGLTASGAWDYDYALLLQPTAGNLFAALLDIADRVTDGRAYTYDQAGYRTPGSATARVASGSAVCLECFNAHDNAPDLTAAAAGPPTVVDCSNATLVNSFCGVQDNRSTVTEQVTETPAQVGAYPVYVPLYVSGFIGARRRVERFDSRLRALSDGVVPPPRRRRPSIVVRQPYAPSHPRARDQGDEAIPDHGFDATSAGARPTPAGMQFVDRAPTSPQRMVRPPTTGFVSASPWASAPLTVFPTRDRRARESRAPATSAAAATFTLPAMRTPLVPSRAALRSFEGRRR
jgi:hypothetical protein